MQESVYKKIQDVDELGECVVEGRERLSTKGVQDVGILRTL